VKQKGLGYQKLKNNFRVIKRGLFQGTSNGFTTCSCLISIVERMPRVSLVVISAKGTKQVNNLNYILVNKTIA